jgi:general secretion pathway protein J
MAGLTLLEMLVVLVLMALIATLAIQGLGYVMGQRERFLGYLGETRERSLTRDWYEQITRAVYPARAENADNEFRGSRQRLSGLTLQPLAAASGVTTAFTLSIEQADDQQRLRYREADGPSWTLAQWPASAEASFGYRDSDGQWHTQWPPAGNQRLDPRQRPPQLPAAIGLRVTGAGAADRLWQVRTTARRSPPRSIRDLL